MLAYDQYGCRVVQKYFDTISMDEPRMDRIISSEIIPNLHKMVTDPNANHVLIKIISQLSNKKLGFLLDFFDANIESLPANPFACRVMHKLFEKIPLDKLELIDKLDKHFFSLFFCQNGNF
jgi:hypothetical protein